MQCMLFSSGLILRELCYFLDSSYSHYKSVGYRGKLTKGFYTAGGLIHVFILGAKLAPMEDLRLVSWYVVSIRADICVYMYFRP